MRRSAQEEREVEKAERGVRRAAKGVRAGPEAVPVLGAHGAVKEEEPEKWAEPECGPGRKGN